MCHKILENLTRHFVKWRLISQNTFQIINSNRIFNKNIHNLSLITVPADGLAPLGARPSAGTVMIKFTFTCGVCMTKLTGYFSPTLQIYRISTPQNLVTQSPPKLMQILMQITSIIRHPSRLPIVFLQWIGCQQSFFIFISGWSVLKPKIAVVSLCEGLHPGVMNSWVMQFPDTMTSYWRLYLWPAHDPCYNKIFPTF